MDLIEQIGFWLEVQGALIEKHGVPAEDASALILNLYHRLAAHDDWQIVYHNEPVNLAEDMHGCKEQE